MPRDIDAKMLLVRRKLSLNHWPSPEMHIIETERRARARQPNVLEFLKKSMGARNRVGIGLSYRPARLHRRRI
jgi:hypothetical protein